MTLATRQSITVKLPRPHAAQAKILRSNARFRVGICGRRFGKSECGKIDLSGGALNGEPVAWFSPTYKQSTEIWKSFKWMLRPVITKINEQERRLDFITGGVLDVWSLENADSVLGRKYARIVVDEAAIVKDGGEIWPRILRPLLTDYHGTALFISTPRGMNWLWHLFNLGNDPLQPEWESFQFPTAANTTIPGLAAEIESAKQLLPTRIFEEEYLAQFSEESGVFRGLIEVSIAHEQAGPVKNHEYVGGLDWARTGDFTCLSIWDKTTKTEAYLDRFNQIGFGFQRGRIEAAQDKWGMQQILAEGNSMGGPNIEALQAEGLPVIEFTTTAQSKGPLIESLALAVERQEITLLNDPVALAEAQSYQSERLPSGRFTYGAGHGHDDTVIARALAWHAISDYRPTGGIHF